MKMALKIVLIITLIYIVVIPVYLTNSTNAVLCRGIAVDLKDSSALHFVTRRQLLNAAYGGSEKITGKPIRKISLTAIEERINVMRELKVAEAYPTIDGIVHIYADQRDPVMRVMPETGGDFFVDREGFVFRKRNLYTPRLHIVEGNVNITQAMLSGVSVLDTSIKNSILKDIFNIVDYIGDDDFWSAQIDQIYVDGKDEIDLLPRAGSQVVHLGSAENLEGKLRNLEAFYEQVLPEVGWNKYSVINLEFKDQIVCKRR
jgi:cell division protein FtsQ